MIKHKVIEGDSLWRLGHRYLGSGTRWPLIFDFHNAEVARLGAQSRLMPIEDENLIYVGQTIMVPSREKQMPARKGAKPDGDKVAIPLNLKVEYTIGRDTPPMAYILSTPDFTIKAEMAGKITVEVLGTERYNHNLELALGKDPIQIKSKLRQVYDPAVCALTAEPEISYESGVIKIKAPLAAEHNPGPYMIRVEATAPNHLSGVLRVQPFGGKVMAGGRKYKYYADIEFRADMTWHPMPKGKIDNAARSESAGTRKRQLRPEGSSETATGWEKASRDVDKIATKVVLTIVGLSTMWYLRGSLMMKQTTSTTPFIHMIDRNNPRYRRFSDRNSGII